MILTLPCLALWVSSAIATISVNRYSPHPTYEEIMLNRKDIVHGQSISQSFSQSSSFNQSFSSSSSYSTHHHEMGSTSREDPNQQDGILHDSVVGSNSDVQHYAYHTAQGHQTVSGGSFGMDGHSFSSAIASSISDGSNPCLAKSTCSACIQTAGCAWCKLKDYSSSVNGRPTALPRCNTANYLMDPQRSLCPTNDVVNPDNILHVLQDIGLKRSSKYHDAVQVRPQHVSLKLRINEPYHLDFYYAQAQDYPVDLYYLMDLSKSMEDDKEKLSALGDLLASTMQNITSNFRLGFGSFVDKVVMPFVSTMPNKLKEPCDGCAAPYGYKHHMTLSTDTSTFAVKVKRAPVSGNLDAPEGSFDAIMQAVVCRQIIGWRHRSRKLLVLSTDAGFHFAGDGRLGGIVEPNDGLCHVDPKTGLYTHSTLLDYPSVAHINYKVKENAVNVIFAVTEEQFDVYKQLTRHIEGSSVGTLTADSSNVVQLIKAQYQAITSSIEMKDNASGAVRVKYYSSCVSNGGPVRQTSRCSGLRVGSIVQFTAKIEVVRCPKDRAEWHQRFQIYPVGINESIVVDLDMQCECNCDKIDSPEYVKHSPHCSGDGDYACGICKCRPDHFGRHCECDASSIGHQTEVSDGGAISLGSQLAKAASIDDDCRPGNRSSTPLCNNRGDCICGKCECYPRENPQEVVYGDFCECDNFSCDRFDGLLCSGPDHGTCDCGQCVCNSEWNMPGYSACECRASKETCITPYGQHIGQECSGHGECVCGECKCRDTGEAQYSGRYCQDCPTCPGKCSELQSCVQCLAFSSGELIDMTDEEIVKAYGVSMRDNDHYSYTQLNDDDTLSAVPVDPRLSGESLAELVRRRKRCKFICPFHPVVVATDVHDFLTEDDRRLCSFVDDDDCRATFVYGHHNATGKLLVWVQKEKECPVEVNVMGIIFGVIGAIVAVGLMIILVWKVFTTIHDRREFARFEKERAMAKWDAGENPIFKSATSTYKNPTYSGR